MRKIITISFALIGILFFVQKSNAQNLEESLSKLTSTVSTKYLSPVVNAFGSNLNSGWVNNVPSATKLGFNFNIKLIGMASFFGDEDKSFSASGKFFFDENQIQSILQNSNITPQSIGQTSYNDLVNQIKKDEFTVTFSGPTVVGDKNDKLKVSFPGKSYTVASGTFNVNPYNVFIDQVKGYINKFFPTGAIQLTVGTVAGTNVAMRYFPSIEIEDFGKFSFWGFGAIHNPGVWLKNPLPLEIGLGYFFQKMTVGDIFESSANQFGIYLGKRIGGIIAVEPYAGLTFESAKTKVNYDYQSNETINGVKVKPVNLGFDIKSQNSASFVVGLSIKLAVININADYKMANINTASAGISLGF
ncbi:MAG: hypothetical protein FJ214_01405 [Ignavibacteria bacterium]|nr:hypothetical protein [Ignavibacteria bacterium]